VGKTTLQLLRQCGRELPPMEHKMDIRKSEDVLEANLHMDPSRIPAANDLRELLQRISAHVSQRRELLTVTAALQPCRGAYRVSQLAAKLLDEGTGQLTQARQEVQEAINAMLLERQGSGTAWFQAVGRPLPECPAAPTRPAPSAIKQQEAKPQRNHSSLFANSELVNDIVSNGYDFHQEPESNTVTPSKEEILRQELANLRRGGDAPFLPLYQMRGDVVSENIRRASEHPDARGKEPWNRLDVMQEEGAKGVKGGTSHDLEAERERLLSEL